MADEIKKVPHLTLLDLATPKKNRNTVNLLIDLYNDVGVIANTSAADSKDARDKATAANAKSDSALATAQAANATASSANATANAANATSTEAKNIANSANSTASTAEANSEQAVDIANDSVAKIQHALDTGNLGTFVREGGSTLLEVHRTTDANLPDDTATTKYLPTNVAVKNYIKNTVIDSAPYVFAEELYEESKNLIKLTNLRTNASGVNITKNTKDIITLQGTPNLNYIYLTTKTLLHLLPGKYTFSRSAYLNFAIVLKLIKADGSSRNYWVEPNNYITFELTEEYTAYEVWCDSVPTGTPLNVSFGVQLIKGTEHGSSQPYNPNRHITNSEAEFLKEEHNKSLNLISEEYLSEYSDWYINTGYIYGLKPNTTYTYKADVTNIYGSNINLYQKDVGIVQNIVTDWSLNLNTKVVKFTTNSDIDENVIYLFNIRGTYDNTTKISNQMLVEGDYTFETMPTYQPYNKNRHITNSEAGFLKEKYNDASNLIDLIDIPETGFGGLTYKVENGAITINGTATYNFVLKFNLRNKIKLDGIYSSAIFESGTKNNVWGIVLEFDNLERSNDFGFVGDSYNNSSDHLYMGFDTNFTYENYVIKPMLVEGKIELKKYHNYNSASHITNGQADLLKSVWESQLNIMNINGIKAIPNGIAASANNNHIIIKGTGTADGAIEFNYPVKFKPNTKYRLRVFNQKGTIDDMLYLWDYKNAKSYGGVNLNTLNSNAIINVPSNVSEEVVLSIYYNTSQGNIDIEFDVMAVEGEEVPTEFYPYDASSHITNIQANYLKNEQEKRVNLIDTSKLFEVYISTDTGYETTNDWWNASEYIEIKENTPYTVSCYSPSSGRFWQKSITYFDAGKQFISGYTHNNNAGELYPKLTFTPPKNAKYVRVAWAVLQGEAISVEIKDVMLNEGLTNLPYVPYKLGAAVTLAQSKLLEEMSNKSLNILNIADKTSSTTNGVTYNASSGRVYKTGTCTTGFGITIPLKTNLVLKKNKTYTFINFGKSQNQEISLKNASGTNIITLKVWTNTVSYRATSDITLTQIGYWVVGSAVVSADYFMVVEGTVVPDYFQTYQGGQYVQQSQIKNFTFDSATGTLSITDN